MERTMTEEEKWIRIRHAAKHLLAAVVFNESAKASLEKTQGSLLACMGYYYVGFHAAIAMLWVTPTVAPENLKRIRHSQLKTLVEQHLIQSKKLDRSFLLEYEQLQDFREYANYNFGSKSPKHEYPQVAPTIEIVTDSILSKARGVLFEQLQCLDMLFGFQSSIGDDIGSDLIKLHSGPEVAEKIWAYLVRHQLTT